MKKELSVIIPVYNVEKYIEKCLESVLKQELENYEIICINDGSTDKSLEILNKYRFNEKINIIDQLNMGVAHVRNTGLKLARGNYIFFLDGDDFLEENTLKILLDEMQKKKLELITFNYWKYSKEYKILKKRNIKKDEIFTGKEVLKKFNETNPMPWLNIYEKRFLIKNNLFFNENMKSEEDVELYIRIMLKAEKILYKDISIVYYRQLNNGLSKVKKLKSDNYYKILITYTNEINSIDDEKLKRVMYNYMSYIVKNIILEEIRTRNINYLKKQIEFLMIPLRNSNKLKYKLFLIYLVFYKYVLEYKF